MELSKLAAITQLIEIRNYLGGAINNYSLSKKVVAEYNAMIILLDKMIQEQLMGDEFKQFIKFEDRAKAIQDVAAITNIKSGIKIK
jgi:hypothetical protein